MTINHNNAAEAALFSVAPMMDWTDRHCRYFHRLMTRKSLLYTEMVSASAIIRGDIEKLLEHNSFEYPLALQIGGFDPNQLFQAVKLCQGRGFCEINLNAGCPSDKVKEGCFGAILMKDPVRVAECLSAMQEVALDMEITLKCRIGVDDQCPEQTLPDFVQTVSNSGINRIAIHARKAWLNGVSPKQNRNIPPLNYPLVLQIKQQFPDLKISINGGINSLDEAERFLAQGLDGVMIGRAAYRTPVPILMNVDQQIFGAKSKSASIQKVILGMMEYLKNHLEAGGKVTAVTRHMLGLYAGRPGARIWRRELSNPNLNDPKGVELLQQAICKVEGIAIMDELLDYSAGLNYEI